MRRILSVFLAALLLLTFSSAALADPESWQHCSC